MSARREEDEQPVMRRIELEVSGGMIGSPGMSVTVHKVWAVWKGKEVTEIPAGEAFDIKVYYTSSWPEGNVSFWDPWAVSFTARCLQVPLSAYGLTRINESPHTETMVLDDPKSIVMPNVACTFRIRPWGHPDGGTTTPPPSEQW